MRRTIDNIAHNHAKKNRNKQFGRGFVFENVRWERRRLVYNDPGIMDESYTDCLKATINMSDELTKKDIPHKIVTGTDQDNLFPGGHVFILQGNNQYDPSGLYHPTKNFHYREDTLPQGLVDAERRTHHHILEPGEAIPLRATRKKGRLEGPSSQQHTLQDEQV